MGRRDGPGVFISALVPGGLAEQNGVLLQVNIFLPFFLANIARIFPGEHLNIFPGADNLQFAEQGDQIIRVNTTDLTNATQVCLFL